MTSASIAFLFPGQGSQTVGMGRDLYDASDEARAVFDQADVQMGKSFSALMFDGPQDALHNTFNTQPALTIVGVATLRALQALRPDVAPSVVAGHSLGELTALVAAGVLDFADGLALVRVRAQQMQAAGDASPGGMAALLALDADVVRDLCVQASAETGGVVVLANDNCPGQVVISGGEAALERAIALAQQAGAKRAVRLAVSIAAHSPLMQPAADVFGAAVDTTPMRAPSVPLISNVTAAPVADVDAVRAALRAQLTQSVRWTECVRAMIAGGATTFYELGPKDVLCGLVRRIDKSVRAVPLNSWAALQQALSE